MREIKFKAWHKLAKEMLYEDNFGDVFRWLKEGQPIEIMQFTGLKDKNGKEIYEGDFFVTENERHGVVEWYEGGFIARMYDTTGVEELRYAVNMGIEITGNIYENKE